MPHMTNTLSDGVWEITYYASADYPNFIIEDALKVSAAAGNATVRIIFDATGIVLLVQNDYSKHEQLQNYLFEYRELRGKEC